MDAAGVAARIRWIDDFPKPGVRFADLGLVLGDHDTFTYVLEGLTRASEDLGVHKVAGIESRGFLFAGPLADRLQAGLIPIRKAGKLPRATFATDLVLEYGTATLEMQRDASGPEERVLVVDDVLATGGTAAAAARLVVMTGATVAAFAFVVEIGFLAGRAALPAGIPASAVVLA